MMHSFARPHPGAPSTTSPSQPPTPSTPSTPYHRHRRHYSSVAEDYQEHIGNSPEIGHDTTNQRDLHGQQSQQRTTNGLRSFRLSVASAASMDSRASTSTTSTVRRFWAPSPPRSPSERSTRSPSSTCPSTFASSVSSTTSTSPTLSDGVPYATSTTATVLPQAHTSSHVVTYIPPLVDATHGTLSRRQRRSQFSAFSLSGLKAFAVDLHWVANATPEILHLACKRAFTPLNTVFSISRNPLATSVDDIADGAEALLQIWLAVIEIGTIAAAPVLFLCLPGLIFSIWLAGCLFCIWLSAWPLNNGSDCRTGSTFHPPWSAGNSGDLAEGQYDSDSDDDGDSYCTSKSPGHWFFVSGMGATSRSLTKTCPRVAGVFGHPITLIRQHTYGAIADYLFSVIRARIWDTQSSHADALYGQLYPILITPMTPVSSPPPSRIIVLAHNTGAAVVSQALARLSVDVPPNRLSQIEIYTFGAMSSDFVLPRGILKTAALIHPPHIEHIAHVCDPCARFGVLQSVREDLVARYCGGVFVLGTASSNAHVGRQGTRSPGLTAAVEQQQTTNNRRNYRMSFPFTNHQQQKLQHLQQLQITQEHRNMTLYSPLLSRKTSSSSSDSLTSASSVERSSFSNHDITSTRETISSMEDYLTALFGPEPWSMRPDLVDIDSEFVEMDMDDGFHRKYSSMSSHAPFMDAAISVDRELAEKREMAAMEASKQQPHLSVYSKALPLDKVSSKGAHFRLSWTGLGATAKFGRASAGTSIKGVPKMASSTGTKTRRDADKNFNDQLEGLETVRRLCRESDGRPGREVSVLAGYFADTVARHREMFGF